MAKGKGRKAAAATGTDEASGFATSDWNGHTNHHCPHCTYAQTDPALVAAHVEGRHPDKKPVTE